MDPIRLDQWTSVADTPTSVRSEQRPSGSVFRGMNDLEQARAYADQVCQFFLDHDAPSTVFVVAGPTSTTKCAFEVVEASCGYPIRHRALPDPVRMAERALNRSLVPDSSPAPFAAAAALARPAPALRMRA